MKSFFKLFFKPKTWILLLVFLAGLTFGIFSWNQVSYVQLEKASGRYLASDEDTQVMRVKLQDGPPQEDLFKYANIRVKQKGIAFTLGNFVADSPRKAFICDLYQNIELRFFASEISLSGDASEMIIKLPCREGSERAIGSYFLPVSKMLTLPSNQFHFKNLKVAVEFKNTIKILTHKWILKQAIFTSNFDNEKPYEVTYPSDKNLPAFEIDFNSFLKKKSQ